MRDFMNPLRGVRGDSLSSLIASPASAFLRRVVGRDGELLADENKVGIFYRRRIGLKNLVPFLRRAVDFGGDFGERIARLDGIFLLTRGLRARHRRGPFGFGLLFYRRRRRALAAGDGQR